MQQMDLVQTVREFSTVTWSWTPDEIDAALRSIGWSREGELSEESIYLRDGVELASFLEDPEWAWFQVLVTERRPDPENPRSQEADDEYRALWEAATNNAVAELGDPEFSGVWGDPGFPSEQNAIWASAWRLPAARLLITYSREGKEAPYCINLVCTSPVVPEWASLASAE